MAGTNALELISAILLASTTILAQTKDTDGWDKVKWGMTVEQAKSAYGDQVEDSTIVPGRNFVVIDRLTVPNVKIGDVEMSASLQTPRGGDQITQISISLKADMQAPMLLRTHAFQRLKELLIEKYGRVTNEDRTTERDDLTNTLLWSLPSTTISLIWRESTRYQLGYVSLIYKAVDKKALDAL